MVLGDLIYVGRPDCLIVADDGFEEGLLVNLQLVDESDVFLLQFMCKLVFCLNEFLAWDGSAFVEEDVGIRRVCDFGPPIFGLEPAKGFALEIFFIEGSDGLIVELEPPVLSGLDDRVVVTAFRSASVNDYSFEGVVGVDTGIVVLDEF